MSSLTDTLIFGRSRAIGFSYSSLITRHSSLLLAAVLLFAVAPNVLSEFRLSLLAKFLTLAIVAIALDLLWGHTGMLSLGHGVFFGLGAYCWGT